MKIEAHWKKKIELKDGKKKNLIFYISTENLSEKPGCYVFYNKYGNSITVLYIGKADKLKRRIEQQFNNVRLMVGLANSMKGNKYLMYCEVVGNRKSKKLQKNLKRLEKELIKYATLEGHELLNQKGTKIRYHQIEFKGNRDSENMFGRNMNISVK
jgi:hypothetical protein